MISLCSRFRLFDCETLRLVWLRFLHWQLLLFLSFCSWVSSNKTMGRRRTPKRKEEKHTKFLSSLHFKGLKAIRIPKWENGKKKQKFLWRKLLKYSWTIMFLLKSYIHETTLLVLIIEHSLQDIIMWKNSTVQNTQIFPRFQREAFLEMFNNLLS